MRQHPDQIQVSLDGNTVWVFAFDGSTVGRFSKRFGIDAHRSAKEQLEGAPECIHCTHAPATLSDWILFCDLMDTHHGIRVEKGLVTFMQDAQPASR